jgi:hypothetical protein
MVDIAYTVSEAEFVEAGFKLAARKGMRRAVIVSRAITVAIYFAAGMYLLLMGWATLGIFFVGLAVAFPFIRHYRSRRVLRSALRSNYQGAPFMHSQVRAHIDDSGISMTYATGSSETAWEGHHGCFELTDMIVLQVSTTFLRVFPKRAFTVDQLAEFRKLLAEHGLSPRTDLPLTLKS